VVLRVLFSNSDKERSIGQVFLIARGAFEGATLTGQPRLAGPVQIALAERRRASLLLSEQERAVDTPTLTLDEREAS